MAISVGRSAPADRAPSLMHASFASQRPMVPSHRLAHHEPLLLRARDVVALNTPAMGHIPLTNAKGSSQGAVAPSASAVHAPRLSAAPATVISVSRFSRTVGLAPNSKSNSSRRSSKLARSAPAMSLTPYPPLINGRSQRVVRISGIRAPSSTLPAPIARINPTYPSVVKRWGKLVVIRTKPPVISIAGDTASAHILRGSRNPRTGTGTSGLRTSVGARASENASALCILDEG